MRTFTGLRHESRDDFTRHLHGAVAGVYGMVAVGLTVWLGASPTLFAVAGWLVWDVIGMWRAYAR